MRLAACFPAAIAAALLAGPVPAASADTEREIAHLLDYVQQSGCTFVRNGTQSDAASARAHVARKYDYVRSRVRSAEDFIRLAATQSSVSGEPYHVRCGAQDSLTGAWLTQELARYRGSALRP
jgi:hypothetical protein